MSQTVSVQVLHTIEPQEAPQIFAAAWVCNRSLRRVLHCRTARAAVAAALPPQGTIRAEQLSFEPRITRCTPVCTTSAAAATLLYSPAPRRPAGFAIHIPAPDALPLLAMMPWMHLAARCHHLPCRYHNFLSPAECEHLIKLAKGHMEESTVVDAGSGRSVPSR